MRTVRFVRNGFVSAFFELRKRPDTGVGGLPNMWPQVCCVIFPERYESNVVTTTELCEMVRSALQAIGYAEIALRLEVVAPPFELSLRDLAEEAGPGYELAFFQLLKERIQPAFCDRASSLDIHGLQSCVRHLQSVKTWSRECSQLRNEIVNFVRAHLERANVTNDIHLTIR